MITALIFQEPRAIGNGAEDVICLCGNQPHMDGFYACNSKGEPCHDDMGNPTDDWGGAFHYCQRCGQMIMVSEE